MPRDDVMANDILVAQCRQAAVTCRQAMRCQHAQPSPVRDVTKQSDQCHVMDLVAAQEVVAPVVLAVVNGDGQRGICAVSVMRCVASGDV